MPDRKYLDINEFVDGGYLQEVNRQLLHPLGLALEVTTADEPAAIITLTDKGAAGLDDLISLATQAELMPIEDLEALRRIVEHARHVKAGDGIITGVWDYREDPEGIVFEGDLVNLLKNKAAKVAMEWRKREPARMRMLGVMIQGFHRLPSNVKPRQQ